jgi:hypothetical protein
MQQKLPRLMRMRRNSPRGWRCDAEMRRLHGKQAARAGELRQTTLDYRGLARALALEGAAAERAGDKAAAADLFLRAGRSAADQKDRELAKRWLRQAMSLSRDPALTQAAHSALTTVKGEQ